jgi:hypothetical protein
VRPRNCRSIRRKRRSSSVRSRARSRLTSVRATRHARGRRALGRNFSTGTKDDIAHLLDSQLRADAVHNVTFPLYVEVDEIL